MRKSIVASVMDSKRALNMISLKRKFHLVYRTHCQETEIFKLHAMLATWRYDIFSGFYKSAPEQQIHALVRIGIIRTELHVRAMREKLY